MKFAKYLFAIRAVIESNGYLLEKTINAELYRPDLCQQK